MDLKDTLYRLELSLLQKEVRQSSEKLDKLVAENFIEITSSGTVFNKKHIIDDLPKMDVPFFSINSFEVKELSPEIAITVFKISKSLDGVATNSIRSSVWQKINNEWKMVFHQGTPIK